MHLHVHTHNVCYRPIAVEKVTDSGPLEPVKDDVRQEPLTLPDQFKWVEVDLCNFSQVIDVVV